MSSVIQAIFEYLKVKNATYAWPVTSEEIGKHLNLTPSYVREQMKHLIGSGTVGVRRGPKGGYYIMKAEQALKISIDGREEHYASGTFKDVYNQLMYQLEDEKKVLVTLRVNKVALQNIHDYPGKWEDVTEAIVETKQVQQLLQESVGSAKEYLPVLYEGILKMGDQIQRGFEGEGMKILQEMVEGLEWFSAYVQALLHYVPIGQEAVDNSISFDRVMGVFKNLTEAMEAQDFIWIADIAEYELAPLVQQWVKITEKVSAAV